MEKSYHFAIDGESFAVVRRNFPEVADRVTVRGTVFARMSPDQKQTLIKHLQGLGYYVGQYQYSVMKASEANVTEGLYICNVVSVSKLLATEDPHHRVY